MSSLNLSLRPLQSEYVAHPGATIIQAYELTNNSDTTIFLNTSLEAWQPTDTQGNVIYLPDTPAFLQASLNNADLKLGDTFSLRPGEHHQLVLKLKVATDAPQSDSYLTFFINRQSSNSLSGDTQSQILAKIGSHILLTSTDRESAPRSQIDYLNTSPRFLDVFFTPIKFDAQITNPGNFFFKTFGSIKLSKNKRQLDELKLTPLNVLSNHSRSVLCNSSRIQNPESRICSLNPPFWPGKYDTTLVLDASASGQSLTTSFYVFPFSPLIIFFLCLLIFFASRHRQKLDT